MMKPHKRLIIALVATASISGCSAAGIDGDHASTIDLTQLETGNYQSVPRNADEAKADDSGLAIEAVRMGATMPVPYDVDPSYGFQSQNNPNFRVTPIIPMSLSRIEKEEFREFTKGLVVGWSTSGHRRLNSTVGRQAFLYSFRFNTSSDAEAAMDRIISEQQRLPSPRNRVVSIPGFPNSRTNWDVTDSDSWMAHGAMLLGVRVVDLLGGPPTPDPSVDFTAKAYRKIIEMMASYVPTPNSETSTLAIDVDGILSRTLPGDQDRRLDGIPDGAVEPMQAALAREHRPGSTKPALLNAGVDLVSSEADTSVYRAKSAEAADQLMIELLAPDTDYRRPIDGPRNLPVARCFEAKDSNVPSTVGNPVCYVAYDRYLARVGAFTIPDLLQRTAAQYKLLATGH
ncbi:hypothetical protein AB0G00_06475 [Nocardia salmonicida]|uniref:DUF7373 family lipoprotein n=1 Tax=Nocardia salmonicida TaxID=53431 RepID=UPI0033F4AB04